MRVVCVGSGSIGMLYAGRLSAAGAAVTLVTRTGEQADRLNAEGLELVEGRQSVLSTVKADRYRELEAPAAEAEADWLLLAVKQKHVTAGLARWLANRMGARTRLLCMQNGVGHVERLAQEVAPDRIYLAVTTEGARKDGLNRVCHTGRGVTRIGKAFPRSGATAAADKDANAGASFDEIENNLREMFVSAGFETFLSNNMDRFVWQKLLVNAVINPLTALLGVTNGKLPQMPESMELMDGLLAEGCEVARTKGLGFETDELKNELLAVCGKTALNRSSMLQDLEAGRTTEIDWITGSLLREAAKHKLELPVNRTIYALVKARERSVVKER
ncbi:ketopantoate reductase family protein [Paenibacillus sp. MBLB4367]|uniref:ketopantoate reductase family protein n=1 Tax=Paenibacillus sp. MBLB4367 TaxID=3384767 RepID=UPI0039082CE5